MHYKLLLYDNDKLITRLLLTMFPSIIIPPFFITLLPKGIGIIIFASIFIAIILLGILLTHLSLKNLYSKEIVEINASSIITKKFGEIPLNDIYEIKLKTYKGYRILLYLNNGLVIVISPFEQFKSDAIQQFEEFYKELKRRKKDITNNGNHQ